jgi:GAF domain-containing protein/HAMP domain-containing protein
VETPCAPPSTYVAVVRLILPRVSYRVRSLQARVLSVVGGCAFVAILTIGFAYAVTEVDRTDIDADAQTASDLQNLGTRLGVAVRDQESAIDDYVLAQDPASLADYRLAILTETHLADEIGFQALELPAITGATDDVTSATASWRTSSAEPAVAAVALGNAAAAGRAIVRDSEASHAALATLTRALTDFTEQISNRSDRLNTERGLATGFGLGVVLIGAMLTAWYLGRGVVLPLRRLVGVAEAVERGSDMAFPTEGDDEIGRLGAALERMRRTLREDSVRSEVFNRFTETTVFAGDDAEIAQSNLEALALLVRPDAGVTHVLNRSKDRAVPEARLGQPIEAVLPLHAISRCPGIVRGSVYVTNDAALPLSVHCPIYAVTSGTLACVPLSHGETVGAVHLYWARAQALPLELRASVARVAEHAALAIGNRRLLAALQGQANTDARTGLANSRAFDEAVEDVLESRSDGHAVAVLMLDIDHFKAFNDRHGHPAGDEALRAFAGILRSCLREGDVAAR